MRHVLYRCADSGFECRSLFDLRRHVEFFNSESRRNDYDGEFVHRYIFRDGSWEQDDMFLRRIAVINGRVRFQNLSLLWNRHMEADNRHSDGIRCLQSESLRNFN